MRIARNKRTRMPKRKTQRLIRRMKRGPKITGAPTRPSREEMFKKREREIEIISRRTQPRWKMNVSVPRLRKIEGMGGMVSSSWIESITWTGQGWVYMTLLNGYSYNVYIPFKIYEAWYYAHSKGTYFNYVIKDKYKVVRAA